MGLAGEEGACCGSWYMVSTHLLAANCGHRPLCAWTKIPRQSLKRDLPGVLQ